MERKFLKSKPRMTYSQIKSHKESFEGTVVVFCIKHFTGDWCLLFSFKSKDKVMEVLMSSQRQDVRTFKTIDAARNACNFTWQMEVLGK